MSVQIGRKMVVKLTLPKLKNIMLRQKMLEGGRSLMMRKFLLMP
jgi:hypothetical protein